MNEKEAELMSRLEKSASMAKLLKYPVNYFKTVTGMNLRKAKAKANSDSVLSTEQRLKYKQDARDETLKFVGANVGSALAAGSVGAVYGASKADKKFMDSIDQRNSTIDVWGQTNGLQRVNVGESFDSNLNGKEENAMEQFNKSAKSQEMAMMERLEKSAGWGDSVRRTWDTLSGSDYRRASKLYNEVNDPNAEGFYDKLYFAGALKQKTKDDMKQGWLNASPHALAGVGVTAAAVQTYQALKEGEISPEDLSPEELAQVEEVAKAEQLEKSAMMERLEKSAGFKDGLKNYWNNLKGTKFRENSKELKTHKDMEDFNPALLEDANELDYRNRLEGEVADGLWDTTKAWGGTALGVGALGAGGYGLSKIRGGNEPSQEEEMMNRLEKSAGVWDNLKNGWNTFSGKHFNEADDLYNEWNKNDPKTIYEGTGELSDYENQLDALKLQRDLAKADMDGTRNKVKSAAGFGLGGVGLGVGGHALLGGNPQAPQQIENPLDKSAGLKNWWKNFNGKNLEEADGALVDWHNKHPGTFDTPEAEAQYNEVLTDLAEKRYGADKAHNKATKVGFGVGAGVAIPTGIGVGEAISRQSKKKKEEDTTNHQKEAMTDLFKEAAAAIVNYDIPEVKEYVDPIDSIKF